MDLVIKVDDGDVKELIHAKISEVIARLTDDTIVKRANEVLDIKLDRVKPEKILESMVAERVQTAVNTALNEAFGAPHQRREFIRNILGDEARKLLRESLK